MAAAGAGDVEGGFSGVGREPGLLLSVEVNLVRLSREGPGGVGLPEAGHGFGFRVDGGFRLYIN